jgi:hypothetical protein
MSSGQGGGKWISVFIRINQLYFLEGRSGDSNLLPSSNSIMEKFENKIQGTIVQVLPETGGTSKTGNPWKKQEFVLETSDNYPKKIVFQLWGDKIDQLKIQQGELVTAYIDIESREYNGRWFTDLKAWKIEKTGEAASHSPVSVSAGEKTKFVPPPAGPADDLPL